jgi:hypothetical protein
MKTRPYAIMSAVVAWFGVLLQCYLSLKSAVDDGRTIADGLVSYLGFFTITTNFLVCCAITVSLLAPGERRGGYFARSTVVAGIAVSIAFVSLSYHFLLRHIWNPHGAQLLADVILHYVTPALFVFYWFVYRRSGALRWVHPLWWSIYPVGYFVYALVRGEIIGTYPYFFIDVSALGYQRTTINALGLLFAFILLGMMFVLLDRAARRVPT